MRSVKIIAVGKLKEKYYKEACLEYQKRLSAFADFEIIELSEIRLPDDPSKAQIDAALKKEGEEILSKCRGGHIFSMCVEGSQMPSEELSKIFTETGSSGKPDIFFVIGSSYGLSDEVKVASERKISVSKMTFPHNLFRVMLCEQIYRAFMIEGKSKYHK